MFKVILVDTCSRENCVVLVTKRREKALRKADEYIGQPMTRCYVYDGYGNRIKATGTYLEAREKRAKRKAKAA